MEWFKIWAGYISRAKIDTMDQAKLAPPKTNLTWLWIVLAIVLIVILSFNFGKSSTDFSKKLNDKMVGLVYIEGPIVSSEKINKDLVIDSLEVARNKFPGLSNSLDALCKRFSIDLSKRTKHNALLDCELLREVYINLLDAKEPKFNLSTSVQNSSDDVNGKINYSKTVYQVTDIELKKHKDFLKSEIKKNFY